MIDADFSTSGMFTLGHALAYSYYPQSFEELLTAAWSLAGQPAAQLVTPLFFALSLLLGVAIARLCGVSRLGCLIGAALYATFPVASWTGAIVKNDFPMAFFQLAALYSLLRARGRDEEQPAKWLLLTAFLPRPELRRQACRLVRRHTHRSAGSRRPTSKGRSRPMGRRDGFGLRSSRGCSGTRGPICSPAARSFRRARGWRTTSFRAVDLSPRSRPEAYWRYPWIAHFEGGRRAGVAHHRAARLHPAVVRRSLGAGEASRVLARGASLLALPRPLLPVLDLRPGASCDTRWRRCSS